MRLPPVRKRYTFLAPIVLSLVVLTGYYLFFSDRINTVVEGRIYRSAQLSGNDLEKIIEEKRIRTIINLRGGPSDSEWYVRERGIAKKNNVRLYDMMLSSRDLPAYISLMSILDVLSKSERPVLIHCRRGSDRTGLVSALALAMELDPPLSEVRKQFSWRYGVFPFYRSIGPYLFSQYEVWLAKTQQEHSRSNLFHWLEHEYTDDQGNLEFFISDVNGVAMKDRRVKVGGNPKKLVMEGWAFDMRSKLRVRDLRITIDKRISAKADFRYNRPDLARIFGLGEKYYENFVVGWKAEFDIEHMSTGCYPISLTFVKNSADTLEVPEGYQVCF